MISASGFLYALAGSAAAQVAGPVSWDGVWSGLAEAPAALLGGQAWVRPDVYALYRVDLDRLRAELGAAPLEFTREAAEAPHLISVPMPTGDFQAFEIVESPVMEPPLQARYPEIRTYVGQGLDDPAATIRLDLTPQGFHAQVLSPAGRVMVDPFNRGDALHYASYFAQYNVRRDEWACFGPFGDDHAAPAGSGGGGFGSRFGETLRTYRLANAATGEYTQFHGGTVQAGMAAITTAVNRVTGVYEQEAAARLVLVANNDQLVFTNGGSDPYSNNNGGAMLSQNQSTCDSRIGSANYDIGHVFSTGGGGVAGLGVVCRGGSKAAGVTGLPSPTGDSFYIDYVAHEMGHQFGANHCFNSSSGGCGGGNRSGPHAVEPGSASTIMGYAGLCGSDNIQNRSDAYFASDSFDAIRNYTNSGSGNNCPQKTSTGNTGPTVSAGSARSIPKGTPFTLTASGSDPDGDTLTYCWEERDLGPAARLTDPDDGQIPLNRSYPAAATPSRTVPSLATILANTTDRRDRLPEVSRSYVWRVTARDNRAGGGGVATSEVTLSVVGSAGPFDVTLPGAGEVWAGQGTVTWSVAGTTAAPISCAQVDILLSTDGGSTFPYVLEQGTPNDGSEAVAIPPNVQTNDARIKVAASNNIFFDINPADFVIEYTPPLVITLPDGRVLTMPPGEPAELSVRIDPGAEQVVPGTELLYASDDGGAFVAAPMTNLGGGLYAATLAPADCGDSRRYYIEAQGDGGSTVRLPEDAPAGFFEAAIGEYTLVMSDDFEADSGWLVDAGAVAGNWERAVPIDAGWGDPAGDADGSGRCFVTGNTTFENVDGGATVLISPPFDLSEGGELAYSYWLSGFPGVEIGPGDGLFVDVATDQFGANWTPLRAYTDVALAWRSDAVAVGVEVPASPTVRIRFRAVDAGSDDVVEAGVDAFALSEFACGADGCVADFNGDGAVNTQDVLAFLNAWNAGDSSADINGDGTINTQDVLAFLNLWNAGC
ncbi:MAG TPA: zinc-dependent metalloprotease family protein [Phycisphaerales bacterium]|nr:zinc-dependent metalloprotease family protein [Phycisphaerales bacterium]